MVTVSDGRGGINLSWTATVSSSGFTTGGATSAETIDRSHVSYWSGTATAFHGTGVFGPGQPLPTDAKDLSVPRTAFTGSAEVGTADVSWNPTIIVTIPASAVTGIYTGTTTHSVA